MVLNELSAPILLWYFTTSATSLHALDCIACFNANVKCWSMNMNYKASCVRGIDKRSLGCQNGYLAYGQGWCHYMAFTLFVLIMVAWGMIKMWGHIGCCLFKLYVCGMVGSNMINKALRGVTKTSACSGYMPVVW